MVGIETERFLGPIRLVDPHKALPPEVEVKPLSHVDDQFAWDEGEGDRSLTWWRQAHDRFFRRQCEQLGVPFQDDLAVVFERFELVWPS